MTISRYFDQSATTYLMVLPVMRVAAVMIANILHAYRMLFYVRHAGFLAGATEFRGFVGRPGFGDLGGARDAPLTWSGEDLRVQR
jgi:hypothetical protein